MTSASAQGTTVLADDGCRLWTAETGHGASLIMCHGGPGLWDMFGTLAAALSGPLRVIRWDQRGCGRSERRGPYSLPNLTRVVLPGAGHVPWLEVPAEFGRHVLDFLRAP